MVTIDEIKRMTYYTDKLPDFKVTSVVCEDGWYQVTLQGEELEEYKKQNTNLIAGLLNFRLFEGRPIVEDERTP